METVLSLLITHWLLSILAAQPSSISQIDALISEAATMQQDIEDAAARCTSLELLLATLQSESELLVNQDAGPAMDALLVLVNHIESLHNLTQSQETSALTTYRDPTLTLAAVQARTQLVNSCKLQSKVVFGHFRSLSEKARTLTQLFTELATDLTFQITLAQGRFEKLQDMIQIADVLRNDIERQRESWHGQEVVAKVHIQQARETIQSAHRKRESMETVRVVRNIFTLGVGEIFDLFDLGREIENAKRTVASAEQHACACEQSIQQAIVALQRINNEVARLDTLGGMVRTQDTTLQASVTLGQALRTRTIDLTNASLDVSLLVGALAAKSETFACHHTAQEFARGVRSFGNLLVSEGRLNGLLVQRNPGALQKTLDLIAQSDRQPRPAIKDMM